MRPPFVKVVPEEAEQYDHVAAAVLAHIRFRCESDGPGRFERDGFRWWRVSHLDLGHEVGASRGAVMRALQKLGVAVVSANNPDNPRDQTRAYRVADIGNPVTCQSPDSDTSDLPESESEQDVSESGQGGVRIQTGTCPNPDSALSLETLETKDGEGGEAGATEPEPLDAEIVPDSANAPSLQSQSVDPIDPGAVLDAELVDDDPDPEPSRFCDRHPNDTHDPCGPCQGRRRAHDRWERRHPPPPPPPRSKQRDWAELLAEARAAEEAEAARAAQQVDQPDRKAIEQ